MYSTNPPGRTTNGRLGAGTSRILRRDCSDAISRIFDEFFRNTLYWYQTLNNNPKKLSHLQKLCHEAVSWLTANKLILDDDGYLSITRLGKATAMSGLLPDTAVDFAGMLTSCAVALAADFDDYSDGIIYAACSSKEFASSRPSRYLSYTGTQSYGAIDFWRSKKVPVRIDEADLRTAQCAQAVALYIGGEVERRIAHQTGVSSSMIQRLSGDISWIIDGLHLISTVLEIGCTQRVSNQIDLLARRVRWGVPANTLDLLRVAERHRVPGWAGNGRWRWSSAAITRFRMSCRPAAINCWTF